MDVFIYRLTIKSNMNIYNYILLTSFKEIVKKIHKEIRKKDLHNFGKSLSI